MGNCYVCLKDILNVLNISHNNGNIQKVIKTCKNKDVLLTHPLKTLGGIQTFIFIPEFYATKIINRSDKPNAEMF